MKRALLAVLTSVLLAGSGCGDSGSTDPGKDGQPLVLRVDLLRGMLYVNDTVRVRPFELSPNGDSSRIPSAEVHWKSDNESVLSVSGSGLLLGVGYGTATLTAERQSRSTSIQIWVAGTLHPDPVQTSTTWDLAGSPHVVDSNLPISGEEQLSTLTLEPGVLVLFRKGASLAVGWEGHGALVADGSSAPMR